jgi:hypothetical protein
MSTLITTIMIAFGLIISAILLLGIGKLLTGKNKIRYGACGRNPHNKDGIEKCDQKTNCTLCEKPEDKCR